MIYWERLLLPQIVTRLNAWQTPPVNVYKLKLNVDRAAKLANIWISETWYT